MVSKLNTQLGMLVLCRQMIFTNYFSSSLNFSKKGEISFLFFRKEVGRAEES